MEEVGEAGGRRGFLGAHGPHIRSPAGRAVSATIHQVVDYVGYDANLGTSLERNILGTVRNHDISTINPAIFNVQ